jgi:predicted AAA+ superfamily ATPase
LALFLLGIAIQKNQQTLKIRHCMIDFQGKKGVKMIDRLIFSTIREYLDIFPVVALVGPRQSGKTTLAKMISNEKDSLYLDLEQSEDLLKLSAPKLFFSEFREKLIILDEIQRTPDLFATLRGYVDSDPDTGGFLVLGSASPDLLRQSSETLAGRIGYIETTPFNIREIDNPNKHWLRGGFPRSYLASSDKTAFIWLRSFIQTFLQRDIPNLGIHIPSLQLEQFWEMLAHSHAQCWNASKIATNFGFSASTVKRYLSLFESCYMIRQLYPYAANVKKRLVKTPKVYLRDSGLLHSILRISSLDKLMGNPIVGASYEGWIIEQICSQLSNSDVKPYFYRTHAGAEIDLLLDSPNGLIAIEIKRSLTPKPSKGFFSAMKDLRCEQAYVVYPGSDIYKLDKQTSVVTLRHLLALLENKQDLLKNDQTP